MLFFLYLLMPASQSTEKKKLIFCYEISFCLVVKSLAVTITSTAYCVTLGKGSLSTSFYLPQRVTVKLFTVNKML